MSSKVNGKSASKWEQSSERENDCNAGDIQMSNDHMKRQRRSPSVTSIEDYPSSELSFNGRIKNFKNNQGENIAPCENKQRLSKVLEISLNGSHQQHSDSFTLKKCSNEKSPELCGDEDKIEDEHVEIEGTQIPQIPVVNNIHVTNRSQQNASAYLNDTNENISVNCNATGSSFVNDDQTMDCSLTQMSGDNSSDSYSLFRENCRRETEMLRRIRKCLAGVLPPPSVTIPQLDLFKAVLSKKDHILNYFKNPQKNDCKNPRNGNTQPSLFRPSHTLAETKSMPWRDILGVRQHGLSYNLNKASESNEYLSLSIMERFIGAETATSYTNSPSSAKKRSTRLKLLCHRLNHLAQQPSTSLLPSLSTLPSPSTVVPYPLPKLSIIIPSPLPQPTGMHKSGSAAASSRAAIRSICRDTLVINIVRKMESFQKDMKLTSERVLAIEEEKKEILKAYVDRQAEVQNALIEFLKRP